jgi:hypothetical protein
MYPWIILLFATAGAVFGLDYLLRRKGWKQNSTVEKVSLLVSMFSVGPYVYLSLLGVLWGIVPGSPETAFGKLLYDATLKLGSISFIFAAAAVILSFVFRKIGKAKASIWANGIAFAYIAVVLAVNTLAGKLL